MSMLVSTFLDVEMGRGKYLFFLVAWNEYETRIKEELDKQWMPFGADLGRDGTVIRAYDQKKNTTHEEILGKSWPDDIKSRIDKEQDPFMLIIDKSFAEFIPTEDRWSIIWFSDFNQKPEVIYQLFGCLAEKVRDGGDVFELVSYLARKQKYSQISRYFEFKPHAFGASIDVKAIIEDVTRDRA